MDIETARIIAGASHAGQLTLRGRPRIEHIDRVAAAVPEEARALAFLHEILEHTDIHGDELLAYGLTPLESAVLLLLSRSPGESYELYVLRVVRAGGAEGRLARAILHADVDDQMHADAGVPSEPSHVWARKRIGSARLRRDVAAPPVGLGWRPPARPLPRSGA